MRSGATRLQVGMAFEEDDARDELVGVMHFLDRFRALLLGELAVAPVLQQPVVKPVLVDGAELQKQRLVKPLDDLFFAFHGFCSQIGPAILGRGPGVKRHPLRSPRNAEW